MQRERVDFELNARRVSTAVKRVFQGRTRFSSVGCDDEHFIVEGRRGWLISPLSERVKMRVVATGTNSRNVTQLGEFIRNEVYRVSNTDENIRLKPSEILIRKNNIRFKQ